MSSDKQIAVNKINAQRSTGPRTPAGKAGISVNALKHGFAARDGGNPTIVREPRTTERQSPVTKDANTLPAPRPISVRQIEANQRNALHSKGPTTPEGKQASRLNALTHGLRAKECDNSGTRRSRRA
jgi:hypothetical protein